MLALGEEFDSRARLPKRPGSVWNCVWGYALKRSPGINCESRVLYPGPRFLSRARWPFDANKINHIMHSLLHYIVFNMTENLLKGSVATDQDSRLSWSDKPSQVKFAGDEEEEEVDAGEEGDLSQVSTHSASCATYATKAGISIN